MSSLFGRLRRAALLLAVFVAALAFVGPGDLPARPGGPSKAPTYQGSSVCSKCHTGAFGELEELVKLNEFLEWRVRDKHSQAYYVLLGERGKSMGKLLGADVTTSQGGCLGCHTLDTRKPGQEVTDLQKVLLTDGVGCEACHGPASEWSVTHSDKSWRDKSAKEKQEWGQTDLRTPRVRAQVCLDCHVGNARQGKVVTHAMYAAGHPPLPSIEVAEFSEYMPRHWYHAKEIPWLKKDADEAHRKAFGYDRSAFQQTEVALTGAVSSLRAAAQLLHDRATPTPAFDPARWPELGAVDPAEWKANAAGVLAKNWDKVALTHFDCASCHHDLNVPSWRRQRGYRGAPGRPTPPEWLRTLLPVAVGGETGERTLADFDRACTARPFGRPADVARAAPPLVQWCDGVLDGLGRRSLDRATAEKLLLALCQPALGAPAEPAAGGLGQTAEDKIRDYDSARQLVALVDTLYRELRDAGGTKPPEEIGKILEPLKEGLNLRRDPQEKARVELVEATVNQVVGEILKESAEGEKLKGKELEEQMAFLKQKDFKQRIRSAIASNRLSLTLATGKNLTTLAGLNEKAQAQTADRLARYDPGAVQTALRAIRDLLQKR